MPHDCPGRIIRIVLDSRVRHYPVISFSSPSKSVGPKELKALAPSLCGPQPMGRDPFKGSNNPFSGILYQLSCIYDISITIHNSSLAAFLKEVLGGAMLEYNVSVLLFL